MLHWIIGIIISLIIGGAINSLSESVDNTDWKPWFKVLVKIFIWIAAIIGTILIAIIVSLLSGPSEPKSENHE